MESFWYSAWKFFKIDKCYTIYTITKYILLIILFITIVISKTINNNSNKNVYWPVTLSGTGLSTLGVELFYLYSC